jgi:hypothetical protein
MNVGNIDFEVLINRHDVWFTTLNHGRVISTTKKNVLFPLFQFHNSKLQLKLNKHWFFVQNVGNLKAPSVPL